MTRPAVAVLALVLVSVPEARQSPPNLTRQQRAALQAIVTAADRAAEVPLTPDAEWPLHVLRASDGSHYVAFSVPAGELPADRPVVLYVRLATRRDSRIAAAAERSAVGEWLAGQRATPLRKERSLAFGDMPTFGAGAIAARGPGPQSSALLDLDRDRQRERREASERARKAELEGTADRTPTTLLPFEDFDVRATATRLASGAAVLRRSVTTGPGDYELLVGWADPAAKTPAESVRLAKRAVSLPAASTTEFALSSVIVADNVGVRETPYPAEEQTAHPYSIGTTEILPAQDDRLTNDERLALFVQVINARPSPAGKPDVAVGFRLFRITAAGQESVGTLSPQFYNQGTLPADFDGLKGHPIFAAVGVPMRTFKRGAYRVQVMADDRLAGVSATTDVTFHIVGTPAALLRDAPSLGPAFRRDSVLEPSMLHALVDGLRPASPSPTLARALDAARERRFVDVVREDNVEASEQGARTALRALALYALGDTASAVSAPLRQALQMGAPEGPVKALLGACRAIDGNDRDALQAWQEAVAARVPQPALAHAIAAAALRVGDSARAEETARAILASQSEDRQAQRLLSAALIATSRDAEALTLLETALSRHPDDEDARWLTLHALFAGFVRGDGPGASDAGREQFRQVASRYIGAGGRHQALAAEWLGSLP